MRLLVDNRGLLALDLIIFEIITLEFLK